MGLRTATSRRCAAATAAWRSPSGLLAAAHVLALVVILNLLGTVRTVVVPPSINKSFWVSRDKASGEYLEQMGAFIAWLVLDVTPASIDWKKDILLGYVEPDQHGELKTRQELEAARLKRINASTFFMPQQLVPSEDTQTVVVRGSAAHAGQRPGNGQRRQGLRGGLRVQRRPDAPEDLQGGDPCRAVTPGRSAVATLPRQRWCSRRAVA
jgi:type IV conjugative transfer system protein TraE